MMTDQELDAVLGAERSRLDRTDASDVGAVVHE